jgi:hypothetical protein
MRDETALTASSAAAVVRGSAVPVKSTDRDWNRGVRESGLGFAAASA